ncbi:NAC domain-containing protein 83-like [Cucurbita moschata]|uniref:NAC domain-containing protein 83-like n=1 Tax=Cucurbita moschata TaxID=3662 RepID=A0A6J1EX76_CUCMO|nr:NAC domain-containing protein 83-like [Cucurbita moschata]
MAANRIAYLKNGVLRFPPGFRFHPTDEELLLQYLMRRAFSLPLPAPVISDIDGGRFDPWVLPGNWQRERYFFSTKFPKFPNGGSFIRITASGYWKPVGNDRAVVSSKQDQLVGWKKSLVFYVGKFPYGMKTDWIMHEYRLVDFPPSAMNAQLPPFNPNLVLCRIFFKKRDITRENDENNNVGSRPVLRNFLRATNNTELNPSPTSSSSSGSSGVTDITLGNSDDDDDDDDYEEEDDEETSSFYKNT